MHIQKERMTCKANKQLVKLVPKGRLVKALHSLYGWLSVLLKGMQQPAQNRSTDCKTHTWTWYSPEELRIIGSQVLRGALYDLVMETQRSAVGKKPTREEADTIVGYAESSLSFVVTTSKMMRDYWQETVTKLDEVMKQCEEKRTVDAYNELVKRATESVEAMEMHLAHSIAALTHVRQADPAIPIGGGHIAPIVQSSGIQMRVINSSISKAKQPATATDIAQAKQKHRVQAADNLEHAPAVQLRTTSSVPPFSTPATRNDLGSAPSAGISTQDEDSDWAGITHKIAKLKNLPVVPISSIMGRKSDQQ
ncbi:hypothetical protein DFJ73DRAFT_760285 [Zopfochytrium polystomum]|nr:hypothetical protein DFJ73DRAFT_760285 [Zopfochytrium polystomum]